MVFQPTAIGSLFAKSKLDLGQRFRPKGAVWRGLGNLFPTNLVTSISKLMFNNIFKGTKGTKKKVIVNELSTNDQVTLHRVLQMA